MKRHIWIPYFLTATFIFALMCAPISHSSEIHNERIHAYRFILVCFILVILAQGIQARVHKCRSAEQTRACLQKRSPNALHRKKKQKYDPINANIAEHFMTLDTRTLGKMEVAKIWA